MHQLRPISQFTLLFSLAATVCFGQLPENDKYKQGGHFRQLEELLPTANNYRTASGAPGHQYWQQRADYTIDVELDDENQRIIGSETIRYQNNSPDTLRYVWVQLDPNLFDDDSDTPKITQAPSLDSMSFRQIEAMMARETFDGGVNITSVRDAGDHPMKHTIVKTMMRIDFKKPLRSGEIAEFSIDWNYNINNARVVGGRTGYEYFKEDKNYLYEMAQWFPRMAAYTDATGWQHKQFLGRGEFTLEFGDYLVRITAPNDHVVSAGGVLLNSKEVLTEEQQKRFDAAKEADKPMFIVTPDEAKENEKSKPTGKKTWIFKADNVRDFAWASSRKFIWDAMGYEQNGHKIMAMSFYPNEGEPLWSKYSTHSIVHTMDVYSKYTFDYPYPVAISVNGPIGGMEYPMICFNGPRPEKDGTYSKRTKYGLISVIIHEVGHNYFPMIVNSDERQWTWMDEGLNTFVQFLAEQEWEDGYPSRRGNPSNIVPYMVSSNQVPIMTNSESILQFGANAYAKPATALNILRETILGRELFDFAFKEYARRWKFKRPMPADFFRTMEDASGVDLDWFWRGWFYSTDHCDIALESLKLYQIDTQDPDVEKGIRRATRDSAPVTKSTERNKPLVKRANLFPELKDFYNSFDELDVTEADRDAYKRYFDSLSDDQKKTLKSKTNFYVVEFKNIGGLVMPLFMELKFTDGSKEEIRIPVEIWKQNSENVTKLITTAKEIETITLDPHLETADADLSNNHLPRKVVPSRFKLFKRSRRGGGSKNDMQRANDAAAKAAKKDGADKKEEPKSKEAA
jgi:hypothetical protein